MAVNAGVVIGGNALQVARPMPESTLGHEGRAAFVLLLLFVTASLVRPEDIFRYPFHLQLIFGTAAALVYLGALATGRLQLLWSRELTLMMLLTLWFALGVPFAYWRTGSLITLVPGWFRTLLTFFLLSQTLTSVARVRKLLWAIIGSEFVVTVLSIAMSGNTELRNGDRLAGISAGFLGWNFFGIAMAQSLPYIAVLYVARKSLLRGWLLIVTVAAMMWMLVATASRGGFLNVAFSLALTWCFVLRRSARGRLVSMLLLLFLGLSVAKAPDVFFSRLQTIWKGPQSPFDYAAFSAEESTRSRVLLLQRAVRYSLEYPVFGVGVGNFGVITGNELKGPEGWFSTHNTFAQISSEAGIPALLFFLALLITTIRRTRKLSKDSTSDPDGDEPRLVARATLVSLLATVFGGVFANLAYDGFFYYPVGIATALWIIARQRTRSELHPFPISATDTQPSTLLKFKSDWHNHVDCH